MKLPVEFIERLETAMSDIKYGEARISWQCCGSFLELQILEKIRIDNPEYQHTKPEEYHRG